MNLIPENIRPGERYNARTCFHRPRFGLRMRWLVEAAAMLFLLVPTLAFGANKYWSGTKTWNAANSNWSSTTGGGAGPYTNATFATNDDAIFEGAAGTVTVSAPNNPNSLTFTITGYTLSGGTLTLNGPGIANATGIAATIGTTVIAGSVGLTKTGGGTLTLSATNTYTGTTAINGGTVSITSLTNGGVNGPIGAGSAISFDGGELYVNPGSAQTTDRNITVYSNGGTISSNSSNSNRRIFFTGAVSAGSGSPTFTLGGSQDSYNRVTGAITGAISLVKSGTGMWQLGNAGNAYTGSTTITGGTLQNQIADVIPDGSALIFDNSATCEYSSNNQASETVGSISGGSSNALLNQGGTAFTCGGDNTSTTFAGIVDGGGNFEKTGTGTLTITDNWTKTTGNITISGGVFEIGNNGATGNLNGGTRPIIDNATVQFNHSDAFSYVNGAISGSGGVNQVGSGSVALSAANSYTGVTKITQGTIIAATLANAGTNSCIGAANTGAGDLVFDGGTLQYTGTSVQTTNRLFTITNNGGTIDASGTTTNTIGMCSAGGTILFTGSGNRTLTLTGTNTSDNEMKGVLGDNGADVVSLTKAGVGVWKLSGANTYTGATTISGGTLKLGASGVIPDASSVTVTGTLNLNTYSEGIAGLSGAGTVTSGAAGAVTLTVGNNNVTSTFSGTIIAGSGTTSLAKTGSGTLYLSGTNTYTGTTSVSGGTLSVGAGVAAGTIPNTNITNGGTVQFYRSDAISYTGVISTGGAVIQAGTGATTLSNTNTYIGTTTINAGTLFVTGALNSGSAVSVNNGGTLGGSGTVAGTVTMNAGGICAPGTGGTTTDTLNTGTFNFNATSTYSVDLIGAATVGYDKVNSTGVVTCAGTLTIASYTTQTLGKIFYIVGGSSVSGNFDGLANNDIFTQQGRYFRIAYNAATVSLTDITVGSTNTWDGGGGAGDVNWMTGLNWNADVAPVAENTLVFAGSTSTTNTNNFAAATAFLGISFSNGANPFTLNGSNSVTLGTGGITNNDNDLQIINVPLVFSATRTVNTASTGSITLGGAISGAGDLTKTGAQTLTLSATNTYTGTTTVSGGTLSIGAGGTAGAISNSSNITDNATVQFYRSDAVSYTGVISGTGAMTQAGSGTLTLSNTNTYTGATTVSAGALLITGSTASGSAVSVTGTLGGTGTVNGAITVNNTGTIAPGTGGTTIGTLSTGNVTFDATSTYSVDLNGNTPTYDQINSTGTVALGLAVNNLTVASIANSANGKVYTIITATTALSGTFSGKAEASTFDVSGRTLRINYTATQVTLTDVTGGGVSTFWSQSSLGTINGAAINESALYLATGSTDYLYSRSLITGNENWNYPTGHGACHQPTYFYTGTVYKVLASAVDWVIARQDDGASSSQIFAPLNLAGAGTPYVSYNGASFFVPYTGNLTKRSMADPTSGPVTVAVGSISTSADIVEGSDYVYCATTDGYINRYDAADLTHLTQSAQISGGPSVNLPLVYSMGTLYVTPNNSTVQAFTTSTMGAAKWSMTYSGAATGATNGGAAYIIQSRDTLYTAAGNYVVKVGCLSASASTKWTYDAGDAVNSGPICYGATVYFGRNTGSYYALDDATGLIRTNWPYTSASGDATSGPWIDVTNSRVIFGTTGGNLDAFTLEP